jgi:uncharacterized protein (TIGR02246 family)
MRSARLLVLVSVALVAGCRRGSSAADLSPADITAIRATSARWLAAVRQGHWDEAAATYADDAILWFPNAAHKGKAAILKSLQAQEPMSTLDLQIDEIRGRGDMAFVSGYSTITAVGAAPVVVAKYMDIRLRQADGTWLFYRDMVSPVPPPD